MDPFNKSVRPVYLNLFAFSFPITAIASIIHRITGVLLALGLIPIIIIWHRSLHSEAGFAMVVTWLTIIPVRFFLWAYLATLFYHALAGIRHLIMDLGFGESRSTARIMSWAVIFISFVFVIVLGYVLFFL